MSQNLTAALEQRCAARGYDRITSREEAPLSEAVAMMVREKLTGKAPPPSARKLVDQWRSWIEEKAGPDIERLQDVIEDQAAFARATRDNTCRPRHGR